jgi:hypothetical protein
MSAESDFQSLLIADAGVTALVSDRVALNAVPDDSPLPLVVYGASHAPVLGLNGNQLDDDVTFAVQCWGSTYAEARAVADAVIAAVRAAPAAKCTAVLDEASIYDPDAGLDGVSLTVSWWDS